MYLHSSLRRFLHTSKHQLSFKRLTKNNNASTARIIQEHTNIGMALIRQVAFESLFVKGWKCERRLIVILIILIIQLIFHILI